LEPNGHLISLPESGRYSFRLSKRSQSKRTKQVSGTLAVICLHAELAAYSEGGFIAMMRMDRPKNSTPSIINDGWKTALIINAF